MSTETVNSSVDFEELLRLRSLRADLMRLKAAQKENGIAFFRPHPAQQRFFEAAHKKRRYVRTGNRWGKSTAGAAEDIAWCMGERIWLDESDPMRYHGIPQRSVKGVLICSDWSKAEEIFTSQVDGEGRGKIFKLLPQNAFAGVDKSAGGEICAIHIRSKWGGVSTLYIDTVRSFASNPMGHESSDWDFVHVDEPLPQGMWEAYARGLMDRMGSAWFMCTPLEELWINDLFIPRERSLENFPDGTVFDQYWVMTGTTFDNPYMGSDSIELMKSDARAEELQARLYGRPRQFAGIVHKSYERGTHVYSAVPHGWVHATKPPKSWTIRMAIDPHLKIPHAVLMAATGPMGHSYFFTEIFRPGMIKDLCDSIHERFKDCSPDGVPHAPFMSVCDPLAWNPNPVDGRRFVDVFHAEGIPVHPGSKDLSYSIIRTEDLLAARDDFGNPMVQIHESCTTLLFELDRYIWDSKREKPKDNQADHMIENLHRLVMMGLTHVESSQKFVPINLAPVNLAHRSTQFSSRYAPTKKRSRFDLNTRYPSC